jgi:hypothetical protein
MLQPLILKAYNSHSIVLVETALLTTEYSYLPPLISSHAPPSRLSVDKLWRYGTPVLPTANCFISLSTLLTSSAWQELNKIFKVILDSQPGHKSACGTHLFKNFTSYTFEISRDFIRAMNKVESVLAFLLILLESLFELWLAQSRGGYLLNGHFIVSCR